MILVLIPALVWGGTPASGNEAAGPQWSHGPKVELAPGVAYQELEGSKPGGNGGQALPLRAHVLWVDAGDKEVRIKVVPGGDKLGDRAVLSRLAVQHGALAAVNGGYFCLETGQPDGNLVVDGRLVTTAPGSQRTALGVFGRTGIAIGHFEPRVWLEARGETYPVQRFNRPPHPDGLTVYTPDWGPVVPVFSGMAVSVRRDGDQELVTGRSALRVPIPEDGYVVVFTGRSAARAYEFVPGARVRLQVDLGGDHLAHLLEGGPLLVENGRPVPGRAVAEGFTGSILNPNPRTAVGVTADGYIMLVVVDGRQPDWSVGLDFDELAALLADLGAVQAAALDGGGSSTLWAAGQVLNRPSEGAQRRLANAVLVLYGIPVYLNDALLFFDVPAVLNEQGRTMVPLRGVFEAVGAAVAWDPQARKVTATRGERTVSLVIGSRTAYVNGAAYQLDVPPGIYRDRTMVPLRFVGESLGAAVHWEPGDPGRVYLRL